MVMRLYNTLIKTKETFKPLSKDKVLYYTCGPTVHDYAHIGNFRTFVVQDVLKRWLKSNGYTVKHVMNLTDVDEKTIERAAKKKMTLRSLTRKYEKAFLEDLDCLGIERADDYPRVSDNIDVIAEMVKGLIDGGYSIKGGDGSVYFDINRFRDYGVLSGRHPKRRIRAKIDREDYKEPKNFLLWKACDGRDGSACWSQSIGKGRPGWHIECAALAGEYLGKTLDIHSGGVDLIFPHHENEIAEAESYNGTPFSRFWVHVEHLIVYGKKMSKSHGNFYTLRQLIRKEYDPRAIRLLYMKTHYRSKLNFSFERLRDAENDVRFVETISTGLEQLDRFGNESYVSEVKEFKRTFSELLDDDLGTDKALEQYLVFLRGVERVMKNERLSRKGVESIKDVMNWVNSILGIMGECRLTL